MSTCSTPSRARLPSICRRMRSRERPWSSGSPSTELKTFVVSVGSFPVCARQRPIQVSLRPPPYASAVSKSLIPSDQAASMIAKASSSLSPWPKKAGAEPIPPKFPQPRMRRPSSRSRFHASR